MTMEKSAAVTESMKEDEREECPICKVGGWSYGGLLDTEDGTRACPFCVAAFRPWDSGRITHPGDGIEFMGAFHDFGEDVISYHLNLSSRYRHLKVECEDILPDALWSFATGDTSEVLETANLVFERVTLERILRAIETAYAVADEWQNEWHYEETKRAVRRHDVLPVWEFWLRAAGADGKITCPDDGMTRWYRYGKYFAESCGVNPKEV
jgi:hypothetical protein